MSFFDAQNPGIGGLEELTPNEEAFLMNLAGLSFDEGDVLTIDSGVPAWLAPALGGSGARVVTITAGNVTLGEVSGTDYICIVAGAHTVTLPTAVANTNRYTVKNLHIAAITIDTTSSQTIDGTTSIEISPEDSVDILSDGTNWVII